MVIDVVEAGDDGIRKRPTQKQLLDLLELYHANYVPHATIA